MYVKILNKVQDLYNKKTFKNEDRVVLDFIKRLNLANNKISYLEIGSGLCRFPLILNNLYKFFEIKCVEKNIDLVNFGKNVNLNVSLGDVEVMNFADKEFDIVHCSHVIEHLDYKKLIHALDEMLRVLKIGGYLIIRSPLEYPGFYSDIDHVRPYPPEAVLNYFKNKQQQKISVHNVAEVSRWYRKEALLIYNSSMFSSKFINYILKFFWLLVGYPRSRSNGYVLILKKDS